jgi:hypothetical protein
MVLLISVVCRPKPDIGGRGGSLVVASCQFPVPSFSFQFSVFGFQFSVFGFQFSVFHPLRTGNWQLRTKKGSSIGKMELPLPSGVILKPPGRSSGSGIHRGGGGLPAGLQPGSGGLAALSSPRPPSQRRVRPGFAPGSGMPGGFPIFRKNSRPSQEKIVANQSPLRDCGRG